MTEHDRGRPGRGATTGIAGAAALVTLVTAASRLTGFGREAVMAAVYGATRELDAYLVATGLPNVVIALVSTVAVTAFIPQVAERVRGGDVVGGHRLFRAVAVAVVAALGLGSVVMALFAPAVVALMAPGFDAAARALAVELTRVLLLATVFVAGMNLVSGLLQVHGRFFWPAFVGIPFNLVMVAAAVGFGRRYGVAALAWGFVAGSVVRVVVQLPALRRSGFRWLGRVDWRDPGLRAVVALLPVLALSHVTANVNSFVDRIVGSTLEPGAISALNYAYRLVTLPHGLVVVALLQVLYPALGASGTHERRAEFRRLLSAGAGALLVLLVPLAVALVVLARPVVEVVYGRGAFGDEAVVRTAVALAAYAPGLVALGIRDLGTRALYGLGDRRAPVVAAVVGMAVNVVGDVTLAPRFGVAGLGAATSLSFVVAAAIVLVALVRRHAALSPRPLLAGLGRGLAVAPVTALATGGVATSVAGAGSAWRTAAAVVTGGVVGLVVHVGALRLVRAAEARAFLDAIGRTARRVRIQLSRRT